MLSRVSVRAISTCQIKQSQVINVVHPTAVSDQRNNAIPYADVPGPKPVPFFGNSWRFLPYIGKL